MRWILPRPEYATSDIQLRSFHWCPNRFDVNTPSVVVVVVIVGCGMRMNRWTDCGYSINFNEFEFGAHTRHTQCDDRSRIDSNRHICRNVHVPHSVSLQIHAESVDRKLFRMEFRCSLPCSFLFGRAFSSSFLFFFIIIFSFFKMPFAFFKSNKELNRRRQRMTNSYVRMSRAAHT